MSHRNLVLAYHGCDITVRDDLVSGRIKLKHSTNRYDWLGSGIYLYESDLERALAHAKALHQSEPTSRFGRSLESPNNAKAGERTGSGCRWTNKSKSISSSYEASGHVWRNDVPRPNRLLYSVRRLFPKGVLHPWQQPKLSICALMESVNNNDR